jgi:protein tyrosine phosphatase type IVA
MSVLSSKPTLIEWGSVRFLIMDKPKDSNLHLYLKECKKHNVTDIVRICEPCYDAAEVEKSGIHLHVSGFPRVELLRTDTHTTPANP